MPRSLPPHPDLTQLKNRAKTLLKAHKNGDADVCRVLRTLPRFVEAADQETLAADVALHEVQHALALDYGFRSWAALKRHVLSLSSAAVDGVDGGVRPQRERDHGARPTGNCAIRGVVVAADSGAPIPHATVYLFYLGTHTPLFIEVAGDGSFCFDEIPAGTYSLRTTHTRGFQDAVYNPEDALGRFPQFSLADAERREGLVLEAEPACSITGKVLDENGTPLRDPRGFRVLAWEGGSDGAAKWHTAAQSTVDAADGSYFLDGLGGRPVHVMAIDWQAWGKDYTYPPRYYPGTFSRNEATLVTFDQERQLCDIDIPLRRQGGFVLAGTVTEESTGEPVQDAFIAVHREDMLFDFVTAYTDEHGRYRAEGLAPGAFIAHVDAVHHGLVRTREPVRILAEDARLDFKVTRGVTIAGRFVDERGDDWRIARSHGHVRIQDSPQPGSSFSLTNFRNRHRPADARGESGGEFVAGRGDYGSGDMIFPTPATFILQGLLPGNTIIGFEPKREGQVVKQILHRGQDIRETGLRTQAGETIDDIIVVVGAKSS